MGQKHREKMPQPLSLHLEDNLASLRAAADKRSDMVIRSFHVPTVNQMEYALVYIEGLVDLTSINESLLRPLMSVLSVHDGDSAERFAAIQNCASAAGPTVIVEDMESLWQQIMQGDTVILAQGYRQAVASGTSGGEWRSIAEPTTQNVIRGPKEAFTESLRTNTSMISRRLKSPNLRIQNKIIGEQTQTSVSVLYLEGIADDSVVHEIQRRLDRIQIDGILEGGYIEELIGDAALSPFPTMFNTERPDAVTAGLLEGQIAIVVDGSPFVLLAPVTFFAFFESSEDYYQRFYIASFLRLLRFGAFFISLLLPSLYIAVTTYHQEMLPTTLLVSLVAQREGVPLPALIEAFLMEITFEVLREAGVRMPKAIGSAISIVGALVLGQAAVEAGLISAAMVIIVSFTAISNFVIPSPNLSVTVGLIRFTMMLLGGTLGLYGVMVGLMLLCIHLASLRSFGVPYLMPVAPLIWSNLKDVFIRFPLWSMRTRPDGIAGKNRIRQKKTLKPQPPQPNPGKE
ncbi:spore germination protein [Paenibacillus sp. MBLB2552]|uniref:Spore germination protein n=1 Tax=Paenibacillus mellifer TaxID=2937794 RepID=A0A9X2BQY9_9BACL|nr:spore germination protein [Paenibacillus mellifer]MCK8488372.1 spore germination protein [Paenibacillus mellifer]